MYNAAVDLSALNNLQSPSLFFIFSKSLLSSFLLFSSVPYVFLILRNLSSASKWTSSSSGFFFLFYFFFSSSYSSFFSLFWPFHFLLVSIQFFFSYLFDFLYFFVTFSIFILLPVILFLLFKINSSPYAFFFSKLPFIFIFFFFDCMPHSFVVSLGKTARIFKFVLAVSEKSLAFFGWSFSLFLYIFFSFFFYIFLALCTLYFPAFHTFFLLTSSIFYLPHTFPFNYFCNYFFNFVLKYPSCNYEPYFIVHRLKMY